MAAKQLEGMPTIQSTIGVLLGTLGVIGECTVSFKTPEITKRERGNHSSLFMFLFTGIILIIIFVRLSYQNPTPPNKACQERVPLRVSL